MNHRFGGPLLPALVFVFLLAVAGSAFVSHQREEALRAVLTRLQDAPLRVAYAGKRRYVLYRGDRKREYSVSIWNLPPGEPRFQMPEGRRSWGGRSLRPEHGHEDNGSADSRESSRRRGFGMLGGKFLRHQDRFCDLDLLWRNYDVSVEGEDLIAGRSALRIRVSPRRAGRPTQVAWVDRDWGILLGARTEVAGCPEPTSSWQFEEITFEPDVATAPPARANGPFQRTHVSIERAAGDVSFPVLLWPNPPAGFSLHETAALEIGGRTGADTAPATDEVVRAVHQVFTDGMVTLSLFQYGTDGQDLLRKGFQRFGQETPPELEEYVVEKTTRGPVTVLRIRVGETFLVLIGSLPEEELVSAFSTLSAGKVVPEGTRR